MKLTKTNTELVLLLQQDEKIAFYLLYEKYYRRIYGFVLRYIKIEEDAEEIVQEVFYKIWEIRKKIDAYSSFESFLFTIAYNTTISLLRKKITEKKYIEHITSLSQIENAPDLNDEIHYNELKQKVQSALNELTPRQKQIFHLCKEEGLTHAEVAKKLSISVHTVKKHMANIIVLIKSKIDNGQIASVLFFFLFLH